MVPSRGFWPLAVAVVAMLVQQAFASMSALVLPMVAPKMSAETGLEVSLIGAYSGMLYGVSFFASLGCGGYIQRYGPLRISQVSMLFMAMGLLLSAPGSVWLIAAGALCLGTGSALATPCSTVILAKLSPPNVAPLIFSLKQSGVPVGGMMAGLLIPFLALTYGWRGAFVGAGILCFAFAVLLQPLRRHYDADRGGGYHISLRSVHGMLRRVLTNATYREIAITLWFYVGVQSLFGAFFVTYLVQGLDYELAEAGFVFAVAQAISIFARVFWGWISSHLIKPRTMLALFGIMIAASSAATAHFTKDWSVLEITLVAIVYSASAISFHGVLIAEVARLAPKGELAPVTGGILSFAMLGMMSYPAIFGLTLQMSGGYKLGFLLAAVPALLVGLRLFRRPRGDGSGVTV